MPMPGPTATPASKRNEWGTPPDWLHRARLVMGPIELDPATTKAANEFVQAEHIYTKADNGLEKPWFGTVFWNPPYGSGLIHPFCQKAVDEWQRGSIRQMIGLTNSDTSTRWTRLLFESASYVCFPYKRLAFIDPETGLPVKGNNRPQAFWYWRRRRGLEAVRFRHVFGQVGTVLPLPASGR